VGVGDGVALADLDGEGLRVGEGDVLVADGSGAGGEGVAETVAVTVTCGTLDGVVTEPAVFWDGEPPDDSTTNSSGTRATPRAAAEVRTKRRDGARPPRS
jgi:hypothetical protein